jgi:hypothetical protein
MTKPGLRDLLWMTAGAAMLLGLVLVVVFFHQEPGPDEQLALKARQGALVDSMRASLASASEAEKSAVLAITDEDSQTFADQARAATAAVEAARTQLARLLQGTGTRPAKDALEQFSVAFADFQHIDDELLKLAVKNTNLKATRLAFGPAADAVNEIDAALSRLVSASATSDTAATLTVLALNAEVGALRIQALLAPHIAEETDQRMDAIEALIATNEGDVRKDLADLAALPQLRGNADLASATSSWDRFADLTKQILGLSRENTNVRSLNISMNQKRKAMLLCQDALMTLQQAVQAAPVTHGGEEPAARPR